MTTAAEVLFSILTAATMATAMEMEIAMTTITVASIIAPSAPMVTHPFVADYQFLMGMVTVMVTVTVMVMAMGAVLTATVDMEATAAVHTMEATVVDTVATVATVVATVATVMDTVATVVVTVVMVATATAAAGDLEGHRPTTFT